MKTSNNNKHDPCNFSFPVHIIKTMAILYYKLHANLIVCYEPGI